MPNIITHTLFAQQVCEEMPKLDIQSLLQKNSHIFEIGSNGPDFLFFYHAKPWEVFKNRRLNVLGSRMHASHINAFYETAIHCIKRQQKREIQEMMMAYLFGHLCHWALDKTTHPYVFYKTGNGKGKSAWMHHRFESMIDTMMLQKIKGLRIKDYPTFPICTFNDDILRAIARIYVPVAKQVYNQNIKVYELREALMSWHDVHKMLYDPHNIKFSLLQGAEKVTRHDWALSGHIIRTKEEEEYDVLNAEKHAWCHPCDNHIISTKSFVELFEEAKNIAREVIEKAYGCIAYDSDVNHVLQVLQDQAYDTGMAQASVMQYFDVIYASSEVKDETF